MVIKKSWVYLQQTKHKSLMHTKSKIFGTIFGQAVGDALGLGSEFMRKQEVKYFYQNGLTDYSQIIQDRHRSRWTRGQWTDDTDMMLCIANALITDGYINIKTVAANFVRWLHSPTMMGIGRTVFNVLSNENYLKNPHEIAKQTWVRTGKQNAANGALMRTSIVGVLKNNVSKTAEDVCKLTHYDPRCIGSCVIVSEIISQLIWNDKQLSYNEIRELINNKEYDDNRTLEYIDLSYNSTNIADLQLDESNAIGYTLKALSAALWCYFHANDFQSGLLAVVNEGGDADTNAAIACAVLGAKFGYETIPQKYIDGLVDGEMLKNIAEIICKKVA